MFASGFLFNPKNFANLARWYDAANPSNNGARFADSTLVSTWKDLSGNGDATASGTLRFTYKLNQQNGLPGMQLAGGQSMSSASLAVGSNITLFVVSISSNNTLFMEQSADINSNNGFYIFGSGSTPAQIKNGGSSVMLPISANWLGTSCNLAAVTYDGSTITGFKNGSSVLTGSGSITNATVTDTWNIGSRNGNAIFMTGNLYEIILYNAVLSSGQMALVNDYLRRKWAIF